MKNQSNRSYAQTNKGGVAAWADVPKGTLGNLTPADRHGSVQVRAGASPVNHPQKPTTKKYQESNSFPHLMFLSPLLILLYDTHIFHLITHRHISYSHSLISVRNFFNVIHNTYQISNKSNKL